MVWLGAGLLVLGLGTLFHPPLKLAVSGAKTSVAVIVGGLALMVLSSLIVGNEPLILAGRVPLARIARGSRRSWPAPPRRESNCGV